MKKFFINTRWWMYLPFGAIWMGKWVFDQEDQNELSRRYVFLTFNLVFTCYVSCFIIFEIIEIFHLLPHKSL